MNVLDYAIEMEKDGEAYYRKQAEETVFEDVKRVCIMMAEDEKKHQQVLFDKKEKEEAKNESGLFKEMGNVFTELDNMEVKESGNQQLDFYKQASEMEKESIELYKKLKKYSDIEDEELFEFLIEQEEHHLEVLTEMDRLLSNADSWVESPEFATRREEY